MSERLLPHLTLRAGFTLSELLIVIAIIGLIAAVGTVSLNRSRAKARDGKRLSDIRQIAKTFEIFLSARGEYPADNNWAGTIDGRPALDGSCIVESNPVLQTSCNPAAPPPGMIALFPNSPNYSAGERYRYVAYAANTPTGGGGYTCRYAGRPCLSYGIHFVLETSISGISAGAHCLTRDGILGNPAVATPCPLPFPS